MACEREHRYVAGIGSRKRPEASPGRAGLSRRRRESRHADETMVNCRAYVTEEAGGSWLPRPFSTSPTLLPEAIPQKTRTRISMTISHVRRVAAEPSTAKPREHQDERK